MCKRERNTSLGNKQKRLQEKGEKLEPDAEKEGKRLLRQEAKKNETPEEEVTRRLIVTVPEPAQPDAKRASGNTSLGSKQKRLQEKGEKLEPDAEKEPKRLQRRDSKQY